MSKTTVATYLNRAREAGLNCWPLPVGRNDDGTLQRVLFQRVGRPSRDLTEPDWPKMVGRSRQELFAEIEHAALRPLPDTPFEYAEWKQAKVHPDYHIEVLHSFYSVPHHLIGRKVDVRLTHRMIEIFHTHERVAVHHRRGQRGGHTTIKEHMPKAHQR